ncbi:MAG: hypothetical protein FWE36_00835 [Erysipelotrichales bacterium]|nr:hypothetical protein [Erysipelotrichales bacterium]
MKEFSKTTLAKDLVDITRDVDSNQEFNRETIHLFCSPLFLEPMKNLYDKNIQTISCGSGKERGILPGITCNYESLSAENKLIAKNLLISEKEFRIGTEINDNTTFKEFEEKLLMVIEIFKKQ